MRFQYNRIITAVTYYTKALYSKSVIYILIINRNVSKPFTILIKSYQNMNAVHSGGDIKSDGSPIRFVICGKSLVNIDYTDISSILEWFLIHIDKCNPTLIFSKSNSTNQSQIKLSNGFC